MNVTAKLIQTSKWSISHLRRQADLAKIMIVPISRLVMISQCGQMCTMVTLFWLSIIRKMKIKLRVSLFSDKAYQSSLT